MSFLKKLFGKKEDPIHSYADFWTWFQQHEKAFHAVVKSRNNVEAEFFAKMAPKLEQLGDGYFYLTGMLDDETVELILTAEGNVRNIVFVEELVLAAPKLADWKFTALKPASNIDSMEIKMADYVFSKDSIHFYSNEQAGYPDQIDITLVHKDYSEENKNVITNGCFIFLDNYIGELHSVTLIDRMNVVNPADATKELIPIEKLNDFLNWREKEFLEKYEGTLYNTDEGSFSVLEAELPNGHPLILVINKALIDWDAKASHPWMANFIIKYDGENNNGMPDKITYEKLNAIEDELLEVLKDYEGHLNIGRQTGDNKREIYFACKDFRKSAKEFDAAAKKYKDKLEIDFDIYKDKYWITHNRFQTNVE
jgi:hypothetical protein